jgi:hypothetical protein
MNVTFRPATRHATDGYRFLKWVGERIAKRYLTVARLDNKLSTPAVAAWSFVIFAILLSIYAFSPVAASGDSRWSLHTAMSLIRGNSGDLTEYKAALERNDFYAIEYVDGRPYTSFPIGVSILAIPAVVMESLVRPEFFQELQNGVPDRFEKVVASIIGATAAVVFFWLLYSQFGSLWTALAGTVILALGTSMWSNATRALLQHGPLVLMFTIVMLLMVRAFHRPSLVQYSGLALAMAYVVRPTAAIAIVVISIYVLVFYRTWFVRYLGWAMVVAIPWMVFNYSIYGDILPPYYAASRMDSPSLLALLGILFSPSRGLLVFTPVVIFALSGFVLSLRDPQQRPLHIAFAAIVVGITCIIVAWRGWHGGHCFGPCLMTDVMPFLVYFVAFNFHLPAGTSQRARTSLAASIGIFAVVGAAIHAQGALRYGPWQWNYIPKNIDNRYRLWDWKDPQFLRAWTLSP